MSVNVKGHCQNEQKSKYISDIKTGNGIIKYMVKNNMQHALITKTTYYKQRLHIRANLTIAEHLANREAKKERKLKQIVVIPKVEILETNLRPLSRSLFLSEAK
jgi:hypothetical protein